MILSPAEWEIVTLSLKIGLVAIAATLPVAFALAWMLARGRFPGKIVLDAIVHLPLVLPPVVTGWLLLIAFGPEGPIGRWLNAWFGIGVLFRWTGAAIAAGVMALPLMVRAIRLSIEAVDRRLESAARTLGAGPWRVFWSVTLPGIRWGVAYGVTLTVARSLGEFGAVLVVSGNVIGRTQTATLYINEGIDSYHPEGAYAASLVLAALSFFLLVGMELFRGFLEKGREDRS